MSCRDPPPQNSIQIHSLLALQMEEEACKLTTVSAINNRGRGNTEADSSPYVAAIIRHDVGMFAALHDDDFLLDDGKIVLCGDKGTQNTRVGNITLGVGVHQTDPLLPTVGCPPL